MFLASFFFSIGLLTPDASAAEPRQVVELPYLHQQTERCVLPEHFPEGTYSTKDRKLEKKLCSYHFYKQEDQNIAGKAVGICPKIHSTNPAIEIFSIPNDTSKERFERQKSCNRRIKPSKKLAKYKQSLSCSYTPAILAYYHFSRLLGNVLHVPVSVVRTMDLKQHRKKAKMAVNIARGICQDTWKHFYSLHRRNALAKRKRALLSADGQLLGALSVNPRGEKRYRQYNGRGNAAQSETFAGPLLRQPASQYLLSSKSLAKRFKPNLAKSAQPITVMKDLSDMMILDSILAQSDRFGNIHQISLQYALVDGKIHREKSGKTAPTYPNSVTVKEMMLRDNDCGIVKTNHFRNLRVIHSLRHISPKTYSHIGWLAKHYTSPPMQKWIRTELLFTENDATLVGQNIAEIWSTLNKNCKSGRLSLDLDLIQHLQGPYSHQVEKCDLVYEPSSP